MWVLSAVRFRPEGRRVKKQITLNKNLECQKESFRENLKTPANRKSIKRRGHEVETCFGDIKGNQLFRRVHLRGLTKVKTEFTICCGP
ncbi:MAG: transposase [Tannerella sp.]|nr:transposase [Tannerella sp.]